jgi:hypothetical protein
MPLSWDKAKSRVFAFKLYDKLIAIGYLWHLLEVYLVLLVFCLFSEDTNIFKNGIFYGLLDLRISENGSDLTAHLSHIFYLINTPNQNRLKVSDESLAAFHYQGKLFEERLQQSFDRSIC